jgi:hypothetical protein
MKYINKFIFALLFTSWYSLEFKAMEKDKDDAKKPAQSTTFVWPHTKDPLQIADKDEYTYLKKHAKNISPEQVNTAVDASNTTALMLAAHFDDRLFLNSLLDIKADINQKDAKGQTALHSAMKSFNFELAHYLVQRGAENLEDNEKMKPTDVPAHYPKEFDDLTQEQRTMIKKILISTGVKKHRPSWVKRMRSKMSKTDANKN